VVTRNIYMVTHPHKVVTHIYTYYVENFSTAKGDDAVRAVDIPPTCPMLDRRRERLLAAVLAAPEGTPKKALLPAPPKDDSSRRRIP